MRKEDYTPVKRLFDKAYGEYLEFLHLSNLFTPAYAVVVSATSTMISYASSLNIIWTPVDYFESLVVDVPIAILALLRYLGGI